MNPTDILIRFILDQAAQAKTKGGVDALAKSFDQLDDEAKELAATLIDRTQEGFNKLDERLKRSKERIEQMEKAASKLGSLSSTLFVAGAGIVGGLFAAANKEAQRIKEAGGQIDSTTARWLKANERIQRSTQDIGKVAERAVLPLLEKAADIAEKAANFAEENPDVIKAAVNTGAVLAGLGAVGLAVSKGIKIVADISYITANAEYVLGTKIFQKSAHEFLIGALALQKGKGLSAAEALAQSGQAPVAGGGGLAKAATTVIAPAIGAIIADKIFDAIEGRDVKFADYIVEAKQATALFVKGVGDIVDEFGGPEGLGLKWFAKVADGLGLLEKQADKTAEGLDRVTTGLAGSENEGKVVAAFQQWQEEDARIVQEAAAERVRIVRDAEQQIVAATAQYRSRIASIVSAAQKREEQIIANFNQAQAEAQQQYADDRTKTIEDGQQELERLEEDHQERLRKLAQDHDDRVQDLTAARDALGLAKEKESYEKEVSEENRQHKLEVARQKQETARRLAELDAQFAQEQAQRLAQFQQELAENEAQKQEELKQAAAAHAEELKQIREQESAKLRELQEAMNAERLRRREMFIEQVRDLDAALLGERGLKVNYYNLMLQDADKFLADYRAKLSAGLNATPVHDYTGYAYRGLYRMAANGQPEYVLSGSATRAAESIIGGRLTQDALLTAIARGGGGSRRVTYTDQRRFSASVPLSERRAIVQETVAAIGEAFG